jgi:hypothetical protein
VFIIKEELYIILIILLFYKLLIIKTKLDITILVIIKLKDIVGYIIIILSNFIKKEAIII